MSTYLGVSKSILKDVVFCHQEDSSWYVRHFLIIELIIQCFNFYRPLDEDKKVKEKFDSIFDVGKYDKCIDQIRKEIKFIHEGKSEPGYF